MLEAFESRYLETEELRDLGIGGVGENVRISEHATIVGLRNLHLGSNIRIDSHVVVLSGRGPLKVGNNVHIEPGSSLVAHNGITIGDFCTISHGVRLFTASADYSGQYFTNTFPDESFQNAMRGPIAIEDHVSVGGNSVVMPQVTIGEGAAIGALSFVRESIKGWGIYGGNPLRFIRDRDARIREVGNRVRAEGSISNLES